MAGPLILVEAQPRRASDGEVVSVRLAGGGGTLPYRYNGVGWRAGLAGLPSIIASVDFKGDDLGGGGVSQAMVLRWSPSRSAALAELAAYHWIDAAITVRVGPEGTMPPVLLTGKVLEVSAQAGTLEIALADPAADLKKPILTERFAGTGGVEGPVEWEDRIKPRAWGRVWNLQGFPIDSANSIYCFGDPARPWKAFDAVRDKGAAAAELTPLPWQGSVEATFAALQAASAPQGGGVICPSIACVKWWTQPAGALCADIRGEVGAGYVETAPEIAERVAATVSTVPFAVGTVASAAAARSIPVGWMVNDESVTAAQALDSLMGDVSLMWLLDDGEIIIRAWEWGESVASARSREVSRRSTFKPVSKRKIGFRRNRHVMSRDAIAGIVLATDVEFDDGTPVEDLQPDAPHATPGAPNGYPVGGELDPQTGEVVGGVEAGELVQTVQDTALELLALGGLVDGEVERIDGEIADANTRIDDTEEALVAAEDRLDGRIDATDAAVDAVAGDLVAKEAALQGQINTANASIAAARLAIAYNYGRLQLGIAQTRIGILAEYRERVTAIGVEIARIDGIIAELADPETGLPAAYALIATLESITIDLENPSSLASQLAVLEASITTIGGDLDARVATLETASSQYATDIADLGDDLAILDAGLIEAQADIAGNAASLVALAGRTDIVEAAIDLQGDDIADVEAGLATVTQAVALQNSAGLYQAQLGALRIGNARVATLAEVRIRATDTSAIYSEIDAIDLAISAPGTGLAAQLLDAQSAIVDLETNKAEVSALNALSATVTGHGGRLDGAEDAIDDLTSDYTGLDGRVTTAEAAIVSQSDAIAGLAVDLSDVDGALGIVAGDLAALAGTVGGLSTDAAALAGTVSTISATVSDQGAAIGDLEDATAALDGRQTASEGAITTINLLGVRRDAATSYQAERTALRIGQARVSVLAERSVSLTATSAAVTRLDAIELDLDAPTSGVFAQLASLTTAVADLESSTVTLTQFDTLSGIVIGHTSAIGALDGAVGDLETGAAALDVRITAAEGAITSQSAVLTTLSLDLDAIDGALAVVAGDLADLDDRVGDVEGLAATLVSTTTTLSASVTTQGDAIDALEGRADDVEDAVDALDGRQTASESAITTIQSAGATDRAAIAYRAQRMAAQTGLSRVTALAEVLIRTTNEAAIYSEIDAVELLITTPTTGLSARLTASETAIVDLEASKAEASTVAGLSVAIDDIETALTGKAAITYVDSAIADEAGVRASAITSIEASIGDLSAEITDIAEVAITAEGLAKAIRGWALDVGGRVTGIISENDGETGSIRFVTDELSIETPAGDRKLDWDGEELRLNDVEIVLVGPGGTMMKVSGVGFGSTGQFIEWFGPTQASLDDCTEANAVQYLKANGDAYFGGALSAGVIKNAARTTVLGSSATVDVGPFGSNGDPRVITASLSYLSLNSISDVYSVSGSASATVAIEKYNGSSWVHLTSTTATGSVDGETGSPSEPGFINISMGGSVTFTDTSGGTSGIHYRARITAWSMYTINSTVVSSSSTQELSILSIEE